MQRAALGLCAVMVATFAITTPAAAEPTTNVVPARLVAPLLTATPAGETSSTQHVDLGPDERGLMRQATTSVDVTSLRPDATGATFAHVSVPRDPEGTCSTGALRLNGQPGRATAGAGTLCDVRFDVTSQVRQANSAGHKRLALNLAAEAEQVSVLPAVSLETRPRNVAAEPPTLSEIGVGAPLADGVYVATGGKPVNITADALGRTDLRLHMHLASKQKRFDFISDPAGEFGLSMEVTLTPGEYDYSAWTALADNPQVQSAPIRGRIKVVPAPPTPKNVGVKIDGYQALFTIPQAGSATEACVRGPGGKHLRCRPFAGRKSVVVERTYWNKGTFDAPIYYRNQAFDQSPMLTLKVTISADFPRYTDMLSWSLNKTLTTSDGSFPLTVVGTPQFIPDPAVKDIYALAMSQSTTVSTPAFKSESLSGSVSFKPQGKSADVCVISSFETVDSRAIAGTGLNKGRLMGFAVDTSGKVVWKALDTDPGEYFGVVSIFEGRADVAGAAGIRAHFTGLTSSPKTTPTVLRLGTTTVGKQSVPSCLGQVSGLAISSMGRL